jgi:hypothetical protein
MSRRKADPLFGITRQQVQGIVRCLERGGSDEEIAQKMRNVQIHFDRWIVHIQSAEQRGQLIRIRRQYAGHKLVVKQ